MKTIDVIAAVLLVLGGLNWGLVGFASFDRVGWVSGTRASGARDALAATVFGVVGLATLHHLALLLRIQRGGRIVAA